MSFHSEGKLKEEIVSNKQGVCVLKKPSKQLWSESRVDTQEKPGLV